MRQTFGFGGEQEELASGPTQPAGKADISRLPLQAGKFAVTDVFDGNAYAKDPPKELTNRSSGAAGAFGPEVCLGGVCPPHCTVTPSGFSCL